MGVNTGLQAPGLPLLSDPVWGPAPPEPGMSCLNLTKVFGYRTHLSTLRNWLGNQEAGQRVTRRNTFSRLSRSLLGNRSPLIATFPLLPSCQLLESISHHSSPESA